jgi:hypothetical protein
VAALQIDHGTNETHNNELRSADLSPVPAGIVEGFLFENCRLCLSLRGLTELLHGAQETDSVET